MRPLSPLLAVAFAAAASAQQPFGGYGAGQPLVVAPAQLVTIFVADFAATAELPVRATVLPLPTQIPAGDGSLGVIAVHTGFNALLPILKADRVSPNQVALTVQIPFGSLGLQFPPQWLTAIQAPSGISGSALCRAFGAECSRRLTLSLRRSAVHVLRSCDSVLDQPTAVLPCNALITHRDGAPVTDEAPARFGEDLTAWAVGLGEPSGGDVDPSSGAARIDGIRATFRFCSATAEPPLSRSPEVLYAGLVDSHAGLYQINFAVPRDESGDSSCASRPRFPARAYVTFGRVLDGATDSYDGVEIPFAP